MIHVPFVPRSYFLRGKNEMENQEKYSLRSRLYNSLFAELM